MLRNAPDMRDESGSALLLAMVILTVMTLIGGALMAVYVVQYRFIRQDVHRLQAQYAAEAGVYVALERLQRDLDWRPAQERLSLSEGYTSEVTVEGFGGYVWIRSVAMHKRRQATVRALVAEVPPPAFERVLVLGDTRSALTLTGSTTLIGDAEVGPRGVQTRSFRGHRFTGQHEGDVIQTAEPDLPRFDPALFEEEIERCERMLAAPAPFDSLAHVTHRPEPAATLLPGSNPIYYVDGDLTLTPTAQALFRHPLTVVATGTLTLDDTLAIQPGSRFIAGQVLHLNPGVRARYGLFYGREQVVLTGTTHASGQVLSRQQITVDSTAILPYPSVLYVSGDATDAGGGIVLTDQARVDGTLLHPSIDPAPEQPQGRIRIDAEASVRGSIYNAYETELHGAVLGSLLTGQTYFYESPTHYLNTLRDAHIDHSGRPPHYLVPVGFNQHPFLNVLTWDTWVENYSNEQ